MPTLASDRYDYRATLEAAERVEWPLDQVLARDSRLDFTRPFLPERLARTEPLAFLIGAERRLLNQLRGHGYLCTFTALEELILPFVLDRARDQLSGDDYRARAQLQFAGEGAKHVQLFKRMRRCLERGLRGCRPLDDGGELARAVRARRPLAVALLVLQVEWMTQLHYVESVRDERALDPLFASLLKHHWLEECQHAKRTTLLIEDLTAAMSRGEAAVAIAEYLELVALLDRRLGEQAEADLAAFTRLSGRELDGGDRDRFLVGQRQALRWTFLGAGMGHPRFRETIARLLPGARRTIDRAAANYS